MFDSLIRQISENAGSFASDNLTSNESGMSWIIPELTRRNKPGGAYIGVGPEQNFSYIAATSPAIAFILDIRREAMLQQLYYKALFELAPDRATFLSLLFGRPGELTIPENSSVGRAFEILESVSRSDSFFTAALENAIERLRVIRQISLSELDLAIIRRIARIIYLEGPAVGYSTGLKYGPIPLDPGWSTRISTAYSRMPAGRIDTIRYLVTTEADGEMDSVAVGRSWRTNSVAIPLPRSAGDPPTLSFRLQQLLDSMAPTVDWPTGGSTSFIAQMLQADSTGTSHSFLAREKSYQTVRQMQLNNLIIPITGDFGGPSALRSIGALLDKQKLIVSTFYLSNVEEYLFHNATWRAFYENVERLPTDGSSIILRSFLGGGAILPQQPGLPRLDLTIDLINPLISRVRRGAIVRYSDLLPRHQPL